MKRKIMFTGACLVGAVVMGVIVQVVFDLVGEEFFVDRFGGLVLCLSLYLVARFYPEKKYDDEGRLEGMHKVALCFGGIHICQSVAVMVRDTGLFSLSLEWPGLLGIVISVSCGVVAYSVMLRSLARKGESRPRME